MLHRYSSCYLFRHIKPRLRGSDKHVQTTADFFVRYKYILVYNYKVNLSKGEGEDQESIQSSFPPDLGHYKGKVTRAQENVTHTKAAKKSALSQQVTTRLH